MLLVKALANQASAKVLAISGAEIRSKFVGEGPKKIKNLFAYARKNSPCIIFIDEADAIFHSRSADHPSKGHLEDINQFLAEMDGIGPKGPERPMVIAATNRPFDIDEGILRRLGRRICIDVPDIVGREKILKIHLKGEKLDPDVNLAEVTQEYTGSDLQDLAREAAITAVRELHRQSYETFEKGRRKTIGAHRVLRREHFIQAKQAVDPCS